LPRTAWVSVDPDDNDPVRFWAHVIASVAGASVLRPVGAAVGWAEPRRVLTAAPVRLVRVSW